MDDFEVYIKSNSNQFKEEPLDKALLWEKIEQDLDAKTQLKVFVLSPILKVAAIVTIFFGFGLLAYLINNKQTPHNQYADEIIEIEAHYNHLINLKINQIENTQPLTASEKNTYLKIFEDLDKAAIDLHQELQQNINNEVLVEAMVQNYKQRLHLLELLQSRSQKNKIKHNEKVILI